MVKRLFLLILFVTGIMRCSAQLSELAKDGSSVYSIYIPSKPLRIDTKAAGVLQDYFYRVTGVRIPIENESKNH